MSKYSNFFKRAQTWVLAIAIVLSVVNPALWLGVSAETADNTETLTEGQIVAKNYDLTEAEKQLLSSGLLIGETHTYEKPTADDNLITVDTDSKKITVDTYEGTKGYEWKPVSAKIVVGSETKETVNLDGKGVGTYTYDGNAFSVQVDYELRIDVDENTQKTLLRAPGYLVQAIENMDAVAASKAVLGTVALAAPELVQFIEGVSIPLPMGMIGTVKLSTQESVDATKALNKQLADNDGQLDLEVMIAKYNAAASKVEYLVENGAAMKAKAVETLGYIKAIKSATEVMHEEVEDVLTGMLASYLTPEQKAEIESNMEMLDLLIGYLDDAASKLETPCADAWSATTVTLVKDGLTELGYLALDSMVNAITAQTDVTGIEIKNPLFASTTTIQYNMSMWDVTVKVVLNLTDNTSTDVKFYEYDTMTTTVTLADGATAADIEAAVKADGIVDKALAEWTGKYVADKFSSVKTDLPATLTKDIEYVITYSPDYYEVDFEYGNTVSYPYGYVLTLEKNSEAGKVYDYTVNGKYYPEGTLYTVEGDTVISRKEGKPYISSDLHQIVSDNYLTTDKGASILTSGALVGNVEVNVRYPDNGNKIVTLEGNTLKAMPYDASYEGLSWIPYSYTLSTGTTKYFNGATSVDIDESFESVAVSYRLYFSNVANDTVFEIINLPDVLAKEAAAQLAALDRIASQQGNLEMLNSTMVTIIAGLIENTALSSDADKDAALKACFGSVLESIQNECMGSSNLYLYDIISEYRASSDGLRYYYLNSEKIIEEISKFAGYMSEMLGDDDNLKAADKLAALETLMRSLPSNIVGPEQVEEYVSKFTSIETIMSSVVADLKAPNKAIDLTSENLGKLTSALQMKGETESFTAAPSEKPYLTDSTIVVVADGKIVLSVNVKIEGGANVTITSDAINVTQNISAEVINKLIDAVKDAKKNIVDRYYETNFDAIEAQLKALIGDRASTVTETSFECSWTYADFKVEVPGAAVQYVDMINREIKLPASDDAAYRIDYLIDGVKVTEATYTLTLAQLDKLINGTLEIKAETVYVLREDLTNYVNDLNASVGNDLIVFALVENSKTGEFSIVMKVNAAEPNALMGSVQGAAIGIVQGKYPYVGLDNSSLLNGGKVYLQSVVDALMNSGFGNNTIVSVMDANGKINNMKISGTILSDKPLSTVGGKLVETTLQLGTSADDATNIPFYITLGSAPSQLTQLRNLLAGDLANALKFTCTDGKVAVSLNLPEKAYEALLAVLLVTKNIDISDIGAVNSEIVISFVNDLIMPLLKDDVGVKTFENTLKKFGFNLNVSSVKGVEKLYDMLVSFYTNATFTYSDNSGTAVGTLDISSLIESLNIGVLADIIAEKESGLTIAIDVALTDLGNEYEALYLDINAAGITNKAGLAKDLASKLKGIAGTSVVVLLDDVDSDLTFNKTTLLNLNGFTVNGDIKGNGKVIIVDSHIGEEKIGTVNGTISGNVSIVAGKYSSDVTAFIKNGYIQGADKVVTNNFYDIVEDAEGNITVKLEAGLINTESMPDIASLVVDLACELLFNGYTSNYLEIDGNTVYDITLEDLVGIYAGSNRVDTVVNEAMSMIDTAQISALINTVLDDVLDFKAVGEAIENNAPVLSYTMKTKAWDVDFIHIADGDYISASITSGEAETTREISVVVTGSDADKDLLAKLFKELGNTTDADVNINITHGLTSKDVLFGVTADASIFADFTNPNYAVMFSIIVADGIGAPANQYLIAGIENFYETNNMAMLREAFNSLTSAQVIKALKNLSVTDDFNAMVSALGLDDVVSSHIADLEGLYDRVGKIAAAVVRKADLVGGSRTLASYLDADGVYGMTRGNIERLFSIGLFKGYTLSADIELTSVYVGLKLFGNDIIALAPEFVEGTGTPEILDSDKIADYKVDYEGKYIIIDAHTDGITVQELMALLKFYANNADNIGIVIGDGTFAAEDYIPNGTKITATATNKLSNEVAVVEYTIIMLGDVNNNGRIDIGDAVLISQIIVNLAELDELQKLAADMNNNGRIDIGDATKTSEKLSNWSDYKSLLNKEAE